MRLEKRNSEHRNGRQVGRRGEACIGAQVRAQSGHTLTNLEPETTAQETGEMGDKCGDQGPAGAHWHEQVPHKDRDLHQYCLDIHNMSVL